MLNCDGYENNDSYAFLRLQISSGVAVVDTITKEMTVCAKLKSEDTSLIICACKVR